MKKFAVKRSVKSGLPPGTLVFTGEQKTDKVQITIFDYNEETYNERTNITVNDCSPTSGQIVRWINVDGLHDVDAIEKIGNVFGLHALLLEDILNIDQRPKVEDYEDYVFLIVKMLYLGGDGAEVISEQVAFVIGSNYVLSFQERSGDVFDPIRNRIRHQKGRVRKMGADYLAYVLVDAIVDNYFNILEIFGEAIQGLEDQVLNDSKRETIYSINSLKRQMIALRKSVWPLREVVSLLQSQEMKLIHKKTRIFLRDLYDHTVQVMDSVETFRDILAGVLEIHLSNLSYKMNEIVKVLTMISTIFIPLTFITGIYGMNFAFLPFADSTLGFSLMISLLLVIGLSIVVFFRKRRWI